MLAVYYAHLQHGAHVYPALMRFVIRHVHVIRNEPCGYTSCNPAYNSFESTHSSIDFPSIYYCGQGNALRAQQPKPLVLATDLVVDSQCVCITYYWFKYHNMHVCGWWLWSCDVITLFPVCISSGKVQTHYLCMKHQCNLVQSHQFVKHILISHITKTFMNTKHCLTTNKLIVWSVVGDESPDQNLKQWV